MTVPLPLFYFKPTVCWVDDDPIFLDAVNISFKKHFNCLTFSKPNEAISFFNSYRSPLSNIAFQREFTESDIFGTNNHYPVDLNISSIKNLLSMPEKSQEIAVLVVDYNMPDMNGLDFCKQIKSLPIKKILLTGEATHEKAVEAFNLGLIDKFIRKDRNVADKIQGCIDELIYQFFCEKTANLVSHIEASRLSLLSDLDFISFFDRWRCQNKIEEFYLINKQGSFLVKDNAGKLAFFVIMSELDKNEFLKLNDELVETIGSLLKGVLEGKMIPFFGPDKESWDIDAGKWSDYFYEAQKISGREDYYWAIVKK